MITIRRATFLDKPEIYEFIQQAYEGRWQFKIPERWEWEYIHNPFIGKIDLPVFIAVDETGKVVGQSCALVEQVKIGDDLYPLGWGVDAYVLPEYRSQGIGYELQKANDKAHELFMSLSMAGAVRKMKIDLGAVPLEPVPVYRRYLEFTPDIIRNAAIERVAQNQPSLRRWVSAGLRVTFLDRFLTWMKNKRREFGDHKLLQNLDPGLVLTEVDIFPEEIDLLWERLSAKFYAIVRRDRTHLNWKYVEQPHMDYHRFIARRGGDACGYLILRIAKPPERNIGVISDIFVDPADGPAISTLLSFAVMYFREHRVAEIVAATTIPEYQRCLDELEFAKMDEEHPVLHARVSSTAIETALEPGRWFLGKSDHDWDQYPLAR